MSALQLVSVLPPLSSRRTRLWLILVTTVLATLMTLHFVPGWEVSARASIGLSMFTMMAIFLAALACEYMDSSLGMGYGTTLTPLLLLSGFEPLQIVPAVLISELMTGLTAGLLHQRDEIGRAHV